MARKRKPTPVPTPVFIRPKGRDLYMTVEQVQQAIERARLMPTDLTNVTEIKIRGGGGDVVAVEFL